MKILFVGNQGGRDVYAFYNAMAETLLTSYDCSIRYAVWLQRECHDLVSMGANESDCESVEKYLSEVNRPSRAEIDNLVREYREVNWSGVVAAERAFSDYCMLIDSTGERKEDMKYVTHLVYNQAKFIETMCVGVDAVICQTADTLSSLVAFKVARHLGIPTFAVTPAWILEPGKEGGFFSNNEFMACNKMLEAYKKRAQKPLNMDEKRRVISVVHSLKNPGRGLSFYASTSKGKNAGRNAVSPNLRRVFNYLLSELSKDKTVEYTKIDIVRKIRANFLRLFRKARFHRFYRAINPEEIPTKSIFYALHYQPEQSTLAQGVWHVNQVALVENISKSLPLGYTLIIKEHPWGRGNRPMWQYKHLSGFYNVKFCDASSGDIIARVEAVITVSGTLALESLAWDTPVVMLGSNFFDYSDLIYFAPAANDLPELLLRLLVDREYHRIPDREERLHKFLMSYLDGLIPYFPRIKSAQYWAHEFASCVGLPKLENNYRTRP
jgi:hypothetical protein